MTFSPSGDYVLTGTAGMKAGVLSGGGEEERANELASTGGIGAGQLVVLSSHDLRIVKKIGRYPGSDLRKVLTLTWLRCVAISPFSVVRVLWHPKINQVRCCQHAAAEQTTLTFSSATADPDGLGRRIDPCVVLAGIGRQGGDHGDNESSEGARNRRFRLGWRSTCYNHCSALSPDVQGGWSGRDQRRWARHEA